MDEEEKKIRHTITAEETFTLAKDVFDIRTFIKNAYANRAIISRRINIITLTFSTAFTLIYAIFVLVLALSNQMSFAGYVTVYCLMGVYAAGAVCLVVFAVVSTKTSAKNIPKIKKAAKIFRLTVRLLAVAISIAAISLTAGSSAGNFAFRVIIIIFSILTLFVELIPMSFGGMGKFIRWLLSPVKVKMRVSAVALEWYGLAVSGVPPKGSSAKIAKKHYGAIGKVIDGYLNPELGEKFINAVKPANLLELVENCPEEDRPVLEGVLKSVFAYATECGYVVFDPCRDLNFEGTVEEKKHKTVKERLVGAAVSFGKKKLDKYIASTTDDDEQ